MPNRIAILEGYFGDPGRRRRKSRHRRSHKQVLAGKRLGRASRACAGVHGKRKRAACISRKMGKHHRRKSRR